MSSRDHDQDGPERKCIVSGKSMPKAGLIRFVLDPDAHVVPDLTGRLPGRGFYVMADRLHLETALKKGLFSRAAKKPVQMPEDFLQNLEILAARRVIELLSLARKAGYAVTGYEKVKDWLIKGQARMLLQASDGSERGKAKLRKPENGALISCLTAQEMGLAFGREHAIHGALAAGRLSERIVEEAAKLAGLRLGEAGRQDGSESAGRDMKTV